MFSSQLRLAFYYTFSSVGMLKCVVFTCVHFNTVFTCMFQNWRDLIVPEKKLSNGTVAETGEKA
jgi:hypothetical protein